MQKAKVCPKCKKRLRIGNAPYCKKCKARYEVERTRKNRPKYNKIARERTLKLKQQAVIYKGGKCQVCGYNKCIAALDFHHINPKEKEFAIGKTTKIFENIKLELDKCILICANCHREIHYYQR